MASFAGDKVAHNAVTFVIAFIGCAVAGALLFLLSRRLERVHVRLEQLHESADELRQRAERRAAGLAAVSVMTRSIASARTPVEAAEAVATAASSVLGAALTRIWIEGDEVDVLHPAFEWGAAADTGAGLAPIRAGAGLVGRIYASRAPEYRSDVQTDREVVNLRFVQEAGLVPLLGSPGVHDRGEGAHDAAR